MFAWSETLLDRVMPDRREEKHDVVVDVGLEVDASAGGETCSAGKSLNLSRLASLT